MYQKEKTKYPLKNLSFHSNFHIIVNKNWNDKLFRNEWQLDETITNQIYGIGTKIHTEEKF
jgi:hypothetical protein